MHKLGGQVMKKLGVSLRIFTVDSQFKSLVVRKITFTHSFLHKLWTVFSATTVQNFSHVLSQETGFYTQSTATTMTTTTFLSYITKIKGGGEK